MSGNYGTVCAYCGRTWKEVDDCCAYCGAPNKLRKLEKREPFFFEGMIVYSLRDWSNLCYEFIFYKGITFMGRVSINFWEMEKLPPYEDPMPMILDKLKQQVRFAEV